MVSGVFGRYIYRRLPGSRRAFRHWKSIHIGITALFYITGATHVVLDTKGLEAVVLVREA
jgi:hypothetical protein